MLFSFIGKNGSWIWYRIYGMIYEYIGFQMDWILLRTEKNWSDPELLEETMGYGYIYLLFLQLRITNGPFP